MVYFKRQFSVSIVFTLAVFCLVKCELECFINQEGECSSVEFKINSTDLTSEQCCLGDGYWYKPSGSETCVQCVVYGFTEDSGTVHEGSTLEATIAVLKGRFRNVLFQLSAIDETAKDEVDYTIVTGVARILRGASTTVTVDIKSDSVAVEDNETFYLHLDVIRPSLLSNEFLKRTMKVSIIDTTIVSFKFAEGDYRSNEENGYVTISISKSLTVQLAQPLQLLVSPFTLQEASSRGVDTGRFRDSATASDFKNGFEITFPASEAGLSSSEFSVQFPIEDDSINEAEEVFALYLELSPEETHTALFDSGRRYSFCTIIDDDNIAIGFETNAYTFVEGHGDVVINVVKFPLGRTTEQDFEMNVYAYPSGVGRLNIEKEANITSASSFKFLSTNEKYSFRLNLVDDPIPEYVEKLTLSVLSTDAIQGNGDCSKASGCYSMLSVNIEDNDAVHVGFTKSVIRVAENSGYAEICVALIEPIASTTIEVFISLFIDASPGSANVEDYRASRFELEFSDNHRQQCFNVSIIDDNELEDEEKFTVSLYQAEDDSQIPLLTLSPSVAVITIADNDYEVGFEQDIYTVNEADGSAEVCIVLTGSTPSMPISMVLSTVQDIGSAIAGEDYSRVSSALLSFGLEDLDDARLCSRIPLLNDDVTEKEELFQVILEAVTPAITLSISNATVIIIDDDVVLGFEHEIYTVSEGEGATVEVCVMVKSGAPQRSVIVSLCTQKDSAIDVYDYQNTVTQFTFAKDGNSKECASIEIVNDELEEKRQQFQVTLEFTSPVRGFHLESSTATVIIEDDDGTGESIRDGSCSSDDLDFVNEQDEKREKIVESIVADIAPEIVTNIFNSSISNSTTGPEPVIKLVYNSLSEKFNVKPSETKFNSFVEAVTEISAAEEEACTSEDSVNVEDVPQIVANFKTAFSAGRNADLANIRSLYGKMLCIKRQVSSSRSKRRIRRDGHDVGFDCPNDEDCECPPGGIEGGDITCPCHFFRCLDPTRHLEPIFGFIALDIQCLAFVIDTTGSMTGTISAAKDIILEFIRAEEDLNFIGCYMLVPFNDVGPDHAHVPDASVGPIAIAYTDFETDLVDFYKTVDDLYAYDGGDLPEYALDAMLDALQFTVEDDYEIHSNAMIRGSQIVVLTDAQTKNKAIEDQVISLANEREVCIHFFVAGSYGIEDGLYQRVADKTSGTLVSPFTNWELATFTSAYRESPCSSSSGRRKRSAPSSLQCHSFHISQLAFLFKLSGQASSAITLTSPSGSTIVVTPRSNLAVHSEPHPEAGEWLACVSSGNLELSVNQDVSFDATVLYLKEKSSGLVISATPPIECSSGRIKLSSTKSSLLLEANLNLLDNERNIVQASPLVRCSDSFIANMTFPRGEYSYQISGKDSSGTPISYQIKRKVTFRSGSYNLQLDNDEAIKIKLHDAFQFSFSVSNVNAYPSTFDFSVQATGFTVRVQPAQAIVSPGEAVHVNVTAQGSSSSLRRGSSYVFQLEAGNGCSTLTSTKTIKIKAAGTPPPPDACGCLNGGTCLVFTRRGRVFKRCQCPSGYRGRTCETEST